MACEADADGALTAQILKLVSGGLPTFFADVSHIDDTEKTIYCVNCGAICAWYAGRSQIAEENLKRITFKQSIRPGGAAISSFFAAEGPIQLARLYRVNGEYQMAIIPARAMTPDQATVDQFVAARGQHQLPALFAKVEIDVDMLVERFGSNHISGVAGNYVHELLEVCELLGIRPVLFEAAVNRTATQMAD